MNFIIDTQGQSDLGNRDRLLDSDDDDIEIEDIGNKFYLVLFRFYIFKVMFSECLI